MATYGDIQREVKVSAGFVPKSCWSAHGLGLLGMKVRSAANRIDASSGKYLYPPEKRLAILAALHEPRRRQAAPAGLSKGGL
jgi:hypothetical protein